MSPQTNCFPAAQATTMGVKEEQARQTCFCFTKTGRQLAPVKPSRCSHIYDDCLAFSRRMQKAEAEITALKKAADSAPPYCPAPVYRSRRCRRPCPLPSGKGPACCANGFARASAWSDDW